MEFKTIGNLIKEIRTSKNITRKQLSYGICSEHTLHQLESDSYAADGLMLDILLQRLGQSPDKFEMVLNSSLFNMIRLRDLIERAVCRGKRRLADMLLQNDPSRTRVDEMYRHRMKAFLIYRMDGNCALAAEHLRKSASLTLPDYSYECFYEQMERYLISAVEPENLLALERMNLEGSIGDSAVREIAKCHLALCMEYIEKHFRGDEEYAKLISKCTWLTGKICYLEQDYMQAVVFCKKGMEELRKNTILYFMLPLLELITESEAALGIAPERSKWKQYYDVLTFLWQGYAEKWYPTDSSFHNCCQRDYHLDYELIRSERESQSMTQAQLAADIYQNPESLSRVETGKVSPNKKTFEKLMDKRRLEKRRYNGCIITDSFEVMELKRSIDGFVMRREYQKAKEATQKLKAALDLEISENKMVVSLYEVITGESLGEISAADALEKFKILSRKFMKFDQKSFSHIPMRNETLVVNNICITLCKLGHKDEALDLYRITLEKIKSSKVKTKYRYRSYQILFNSYIREYREIEDTLKELQMEFLCGKTSELPLALEILTNSTISPKIMATLSKKNAEDIIELYKYLCKKGAPYFAYSRLVPNCSERSADYFKEHFTAKEYKAFLERMFFVINEMKDTGYKTQFIFKDHLWKPFLIEKGIWDLDERYGKNRDKELVYDGCHINQDSLCIGTNGNVYACMKTKSLLGNIKTNTFEEIYASKQAEYFRDYDKYESCSICGYRQYCRGCHAVSYGVYGDFYKADPQCWIAESLK